MDSTVAMIGSVLKGLKLGDLKYAAHDVRKTMSQKVDVTKLKSASNQGFSNGSRAGSQKFRLEAHRGSRTKPPVNYRVAFG